MNDPLIERQKIKAHAYYEQRLAECAAMVVEECKQKFGIEITVETRITRKEPSE